MTSPSCHCYLVGVKGGVYCGGSTALQDRRGSDPSPWRVSGLAAGIRTTSPRGLLWDGLSMAIPCNRLIGGLNGFCTNPLGHGIGVGGNLSADITYRPQGKASGTSTTVGADVELRARLAAALQMGIGAAAARMSLDRSGLLVSHSLPTWHEHPALAVAVVTGTACFRKSVFLRIRWAC